MHLFVFSFDPTWPSGGARDLITVLPAEDFVGPDGQSDVEVLQRLMTHERLRDCIQLMQINARGVPYFLEQWLLAPRAPSVHTGKAAQLVTLRGAAVTAYQTIAQVLTGFPVRLARGGK